MQAQLRQASHTPAANLALAATLLLSYPAAALPRSRLKFLTLTNCELGGLPPVVARLPSLLLLKLNINRIEVWLLGCCVAYSVCVCVCEYW